MKVFGIANLPGTVYVMKFSLMYYILPSIKDMLAKISHPVNSL